MRGAIKGPKSGKLIKLKKIVLEMQHKGLGGSMS
jgi:hypothetical protein